MHDLPVYHHIQPEMTRRGRLRCRTCIYGHYPKRWVVTDVSPDAFDRVMDVATRTRSIHLQGWGKSLLQADTARG